MNSPKELRTQINSIGKIQQITKAMQNVAASKMRSAQRRMESSIAYATKIREVVEHVSNDYDEHRNPYLKRHKEIKKVGYIVISTDRSLCGGLNINLFKIALDHANEFSSRNIAVDWCLFGSKAVSFFNNFSANIVAQVTGLKEPPKVEDLLGGVKVMLDAYRNEEIDLLFIAHNKFVSTLIQSPAVVSLLPLSPESKHSKSSYNVSYLYEPTKSSLIDILMSRYLETQVYQAVVDNLACEQVARMVAMKNATENAEEIIESLKLMYNKARQTSITNEIAEIVGGADAV
jgi:ATP synthase, F1 gamma subunit